MTTINQLSHTLQSWIRWMRLQRALTWALRGFAVALAASFFIGGAGLYQAALLKSEFLALSVFFVALLPIAFGVAAYFWKIDSMKAARYFDRAFHLDERVSTALELGKEDHAKEMIQKQLDDAVDSARRVNPRRDLPLRLDKRAALLSSIFAIALGGIWFQGETLFAAASRQRQVEEAITAQEAKIEEIIQSINANDSLTPEDKQALTKPLQQAQEELKKTQSLEGAVSILTDTGEKLQALDNQQAGQTTQALKEAGSELASQSGTPLESVGKDLASGNLAKAASDLQNMDLSQMSPAELQKLAEQLDATANGLDATNPQMAQELRDAANAIRKGDLAAAQQSLNSAAQQMAQTAQQAAASQAAGQASSQMQAGASQMLAAGGGQVNSNQGNSNQNGGQQGQGQGQQQGQGQGQQGNSNQGGQSGGAGSGSGAGSAPPSNQASGEAGSSPIPQNNGAGDGGESAYEQIYAPSRLGGADGENLNLPPSGDNSGEIIGESPTTATDGQSLVPYTDVYSQYDDVNRQAIDNGEAPPQYLDIIRSYFDSVKP